jgi:hypothetical protein
MTENAIAKEIVDAAYRIHTTLGQTVSTQPDCWNRFTMLCLPMNWLSVD